MEREATDQILEDMARMALSGVNTMQHMNQHPIYYDEPTGSSYMKQDIASVEEDQNGTGIDFEKETETTMRKQRIVIQMTNDIEFYSFFVSLCDFNVNSY